MFLFTKMNTLTTINLIILCCLIGILILYPLIIYLVIKKAYIPAILDEVVDKSLKKLDNFAQKELRKVRKEVDDFYTNALSDVNIMRVKTMTDLNLIVEDNVNKLIQTLESATVRVDFD